MIAIADHAEGCVFAVRAQPGAKRNAVVGEHNGALKVSVAAPAQDGRANAALVEVLAKALGVKRSLMELVKGHTGRDKRILVRGMKKEELTQRLHAPWDE